MQRQRSEQQRRFNTPVQKLLEPLLGPTAHAELVDFEEDPQGVKNVASERPDEVDGLRGLLRTLAQGAASSSDAFSDEERAAIEERLSDLGYL